MLRRRCHLLVTDGVGGRGRSGRLLIDIGRDDRRLAVHAKSRISGWTNELLDFVLVEYLILFETLSNCIQLVAVRDEQLAGLLGRRVQNPRNLFVDDPRGVFAEFTRLYNVASQKRML